MECPQNKTYDQIYILHMHVSLSLTYISIYVYIPTKSYGTLWNRINIFQERVRRLLLVGRFGFARVWYFGILGSAGESEASPLNQMLVAQDFKICRVHFMFFVFLQWLLNAKCLESREDQHIAPSGDSSMLMQTFRSESLGRQRRNT